MAEVVVSVVLETVSRLLVEEATFLSGVSAEIEDLCSELRQMQCLLRDADAKQHKSESVRNWLREVRSLSDRIEDLVETYAIRAEAKKSSPRRGIKRFVRNPLRICGRVGTLRKLGNEIESVKRSISNITSNFQKYGIIAVHKEEGESSNQEYEQRARQTYEHQVETLFVGMENDIESLVSLVTSPDHYKQHNKNIISIWGMGGLGKTTIARKVYNHEDVQGCFDHFAWTCINQKPQVDEILRDLLMQLVNEKEKDAVKSMTGRELVRKLHRVQKETKCLIVLDDIWEMEHWESIDAAFPSYGGNSKVLLTTRNRKVAKVGYVHELEFLSESEGWELLQQIASSGNTDFKSAPCFKDVGIKLVSKCGGLPLAISLLGGILKDRNSLASWEIINRDVSSYLSNDSGKFRSLDQVLSLSYNYLPYHLKLCFLYLANFKEDETIYTDWLYSLWITEGLILSESLRKGETLTEVAERCLNELGHRGMVQLEVNHATLTPRFVSCSMHDVVRYFCLEKCQEQEFLKVVDDSTYLIDNSGAHRLVIHIQNEVNGAAILDSIDRRDVKHTRSLFCLDPTKVFFGETLMVWPRDKVMQNFKSLRVLHLEGFAFGRGFPVELQNLIHLRSLTLRNCQLYELSSSVANLPFLHTIALYLNWKIRIPNIIWKMKRLRKLVFGFGQRYTDDFGEHYTDDGGKLRLHGLRELDTLLGLDSEVDEIADLKELVNIKNLYCKVTGFDNFCLLMKYIHGNGQNLREMRLKIHDCDLNCSPEGYDFLSKSFMGERLRTLTLEAKLDRFPCYEPHFLQCLEVLTLDSNHMKEDPMGTLGRLPHLKHLWLRNDFYMGQNLTCHELGFPKLTCLGLCRLSNLKNWRVDEASMLNLTELCIWSCPSLTMLPDRLRFAKNLKTLDIFNMSSEFCNRLSEGGDDYDKIQHVRSVYLHVLQDYDSSSMHMETYFPIGRT